MEEVKVKSWAGVQTPKYQVETTDSFDLFFNTVKDIYKGRVKVDKSVMEHSKENGYITLRPFERVVLGTGISFIDFPKHYKLQIVSTPGLALSVGIVMLVSPYYVESSYKDEITLILYNSTQFPARLNYGDKIAKASIVPLIRASTLI